MHKHRSYWYVYDKGFWIGAAFKCGSSLLHATFSARAPRLRGTYGTKIQGPAYFIVRDPVERFESLWRDKCRDGGSIKAKQPSWVYEMTPEELMTLIEVGIPHNNHWSPQYILKGPRTDVKLIAMPNLSAWWTEQGLPELEERHNTTSGDVPGIETIRDRIETFYAQDVELYREANDY